MQSITRSKGPEKTFTIAMGSWPGMVAFLLLAIAGSDAESRLTEDLTRARRLAILLGEGRETKAALSRVLVELPMGEEGVRYVEVHLRDWRQMRAELLIEAVACAGTLANARRILGMRRARLCRELLRARRRF